MLNDHINDVEDSKSRRGESVISNNKSDIVNNSKAATQNYSSSDNDDEGETVEGSRGHIATMNVNGILTSISEFNKYVMENKPRMVICTETLIKDIKTMNKKCKIRGYRWVGPKSSPGRGVQVLVDNEMAAEVTNISKSEEHEAFFLKVTINSRELHVGCGYQPPKAGELFEYFNDYISQLAIDKVFLLAGDFNARHRAWDQRDNKQGKVLADLLPSWGASILNDDKIPTCIRSNGQSCIDLLITNQPEWFSSDSV